MTKKIQIQRNLTAIVLPIDKLTQTLAKFDPETYEEAIGDRQASKITEGTIKRRGEEVKIKTEYWLNHVEGFHDMTPLTWYDFAILSVCTAYYKRDEVLSLDMIHRALTGSKCRTEKARQEIKDSVKRLMSTLITIDATAMREAFKEYGRRLEWDKKTSAILPCEIREGVLLNGQRTDVIEMYKPSPIMEIAEAKRQLLTVGTALLALPKLNNTQRDLIVKVFVIAFAMIIAREKKNGKANAPSSITFEAIYTAAGVSDESRSVKRNIRNVAIKVAEWLKSQKIIRGFEIESKERNRYHSLKFIL